jgi:hypothetical protein
MGLWREAVLPRYLRSFPAVQCTSTGDGTVGEARCSRMVRNGLCGWRSSAAEARMAAYAFTKPCVPPWSASGTLMQDERSHLLGAGGVPLRAP